MSNRQVVFHDAGLLDYGQAWELQEHYHALLATQPDETRDPKGYLIFVEHPHVYTLGLHGDQNNLLIDNNFLNKIGATYYKVNRGGDITYHGPGQIVGYPILDIKRFATGIKDYVFKLEQAVVNTLLQFKIEASRLPGATGVWLDAGTPSERKICAIGIRASRGISMHGFAFNINTQLDYFRWINPCGFLDKGVTSLQKELGTAVNFNQTKEILLDEIAKVFEMTIVKAL